MTKIIEFDCVTKTQTERQKTSEEIAQDTADLENSRLEEESDLLLADTVASDKASANKKLQALGLTDAEITALVG
tara:strand:+ start:2157 stop:2381 length:225 start_codon:yes stop_codon:yes gene_type:complete